MWLEYDECVITAVYHIYFCTFYASRVVKSLPGGDFRAWETLRRRMLNSMYSFSFLLFTFMVQGFNGTVQENQWYHFKCGERWISIVRCQLFLDKSKSVQSTNFLDFYVFSRLRQSKVLDLKDVYLLKDSVPDSQKSVKKHVNSQNKLLPDSISIHQHQLSVIWSNNAKPGAAISDKSHCIFVKSEAQTQSTYL